MFESVRRLLIYLWDPTQNCNRQAMCMRTEGKWSHDLQAQENSENYTRVIASKPAYREIP